MAASVAATPSSAEQSGGVDEEGPEGRYSTEHVHREGALGSHVLDGDALNCINRANLRYPKTKKVSRCGRGLGQGWGSGWG